MNKKTENKIVLVLGGIGDIGSAISARLEEKGYTVCRHDKDMGEYAGDVTDSKQTKNIIDKIIKKYGRIDAVVNCLSAPVKVLGIEKKNWKDFAGQLEVQLKSVVDTSVLVIPIMKSQGGGRIVNILTSYVVSHVPAGLSDYVTAKYAVLGLTKSMAVELGKYNITVNAVSPSFLRGKFNKDIPEKLDEFIIANTPLKRLVEPKDIANVVAFLISDEAGYITGENISVSGGSAIN